MPGRLIAFRCPAGRDSDLDSWRISDRQQMPVVTFLGEVRGAAGRSTLEIEADTVARLLAALAPAMGAVFAGLLFRDGTLQPDVEVLVNGRNVEFLRGLETTLRPTDQITIFYSGVRGFPGG